MFKIPKDETKIKIFNDELDIDEQMHEYQDREEEMFIAQCEGLL